MIFFKADETAFIHNEPFYKNKNQIYKNDDIFKYIDNGIEMDI
jgi:hypothetical protein